VKSEKRIAMKKVMKMMAVVLLGSLWHTAVAQTKDDYVDFLYKYMPLPDKSDYPRAFYEKNVALSRFRQRQRCLGVRRCQKGSSGIS